VFVSPFIQEFVVVQPTFVFLPGFWSWNGASWAWVPDHWERR
jgi:hypothetical protein